MIKFNTVQYKVLYHLWDILGTIRGRRGILIRLPRPVMRGVAEAHHKVSRALDAAEERMGDDDE